MDSDTCNVLVSVTGSWVRGRDQVDDFRATWRRSVAGHALRRPPYAVPARQWCVQWEEGDTWKKKIDETVQENLVGRAEEVVWKPKEGACLSRKSIIGPRLRSPETRTRSIGSAAVGCDRPHHHEKGNLAGGLAKNRKRPR